MSSAPQSQFDRLANSPSMTRYWQHARERKWLYLVGGVLIATLLILAIQRSWSSRSYVRPVVVQQVPGRVVPGQVVPTQPYVLNESIPAIDVNDRQLRFPARALNNAPPVYPSGAGGQVMPYVNPTAKDKVVKEAFFYPRNAGRPMIPGVGIAAYEVRFGPGDYVVSDNCWARAVSDLTFPASAETRLVVHLVDPARAGQRMYGALVLRTADGELIQFEASQIIVLAE
ncbi:hypothetical protein ETAA8_06480 [Anatilimnocola aggregata]|uniref:Uncharacterized protein n=1 Tax=Anatilimnocola aggregata TaxID=2528021 RepID=A0A517Y5R3_9BACT|nr:hypothetical protein [Anatilimnocola aggregata]QDU25579.1 hypothetical protein ETAA8_06480 [Anatilimnocola aggregata]